MATFDFSTDLYAIEFEAQATVTADSGTALIPEYTPRAFRGIITVTGVVAHLMKDATAPNGEILQVFRIDEVVST